MREMNSLDLQEYQKDHDRFVVIKDFYKMGSAVLGYNADTDVEFRLQLSKCLYLAKPPLQVVRLGGPNCLEVYSEYKPYFLLDNEYEGIHICQSGVCPGEPNPLIQQGKLLRRV